MTAFGGIQRVTDKRFRIGNREIRIEHRSPRSAMGRFGGGWQFKVGAQWTTSRYVILNLLVLMVSIRKVDRDAS